MGTAAASFPRQFAWIEIETSCWKFSQRGILLCQITLALLQTISIKHIVMVWRRRLQHIYLETEGVSYTAAWRKKERNK